MEPFYFGTAEKRLFGAYHRAQKERRPCAGVVMCHPMGQEYIRSHRAFLRLAVHLSAAGFHVLRFDFSGCGDSAGAFEDARLRCWLDDAGMAVDELREGCAIETMCMLGLRLGASVSVRVANRRGDIDLLALWEPVVDGGAYITELLASHEQWLGGSFAVPRQNDTGGDAREVLGYVLTDRLLEDVRSIDLRAMREHPARAVLLVESSKNGLCGEYIDVLRRLDCSVTLETFPGTEVWVRREDELDKSVVPLRVLERMVAWLSEMVW